MTRTVKLAVDGMTCSGCVRSVTNAVTGVAGVAKVDVSLATNSATVEFDAASTSPGAIVEAIVEAGFEARVAG
jgi:copper chaperone